MAEYISKFDQYTGQTGWLATDHQTRFYNGLNNHLKDNLAISDCAIGTYKELRTAAHILDQRMQQRQAEKHGKTMTSPAPSKDPNAMEVDASCQSVPKENHNRRTFVTFMKGKCYSCGSTDHTKANGKHEHDICGHCKKVGHCSPVCFNKYLGKPIAAKAAAMQPQQQHHRWWLKLTLPSPPRVKHQPKIVRNKQTYWPNSWHK